MLIELHGKAGTLCSSAKQGLQRCPLIVRPTSEDNVTSHLVHALRLLNPRHWVSDFLNVGLKSERFPRQIYRNFRVEPWAVKPPFPRELVPWEEGATEVDVELSWENPPTTVYVECKYGSELSARTNQNDGTHGFPADQLVRNIRVGLRDCGRYARNALFDSPPRDFVVLVLAPNAGRELVQRYRDLTTLKSAIPKHESITSWPRAPFVGELGYGDLREVLVARRRFMNRTERQIVDGLLDYLAFKHQMRPERSGRPHSGRTRPLEPRQRPV